MTLEQLTLLMKEAGAHLVRAKVLAANDNNKNGVYLGSDFSALNILPTAAPRPDGRNREGPIFKAAVQYAWISDEGDISGAPHTQLILYPQYPEVRLSGFLQGSTIRPSALMTARLPGRILFIGVTDRGQILGYVAHPESPLAREFRALRNLPEHGVFVELLAGGTDSSKKRLLQELSRISAAGWVDSVRLSASGIPQPCESSNCGGYTLEAGLGIIPNGRSEPDYLGWELKQHAVRDFTRAPSGAITLMTPEPTGGYYRESGALSFVEQFGYPDRRGKADRLNFGGIHRVGQQSASTGLTLTLLGYDLEKYRIVDEAGGIALVSATGKCAALWSFESLMRHWQRKHASAAFIPSRRRTQPRRQYLFGPLVRLGIGTDFLRLLRAFAEGKVYYDPGIKVESYPRQPVTKRRSQFRVPFSALSGLYEHWELITLS